MLIELTLSDWYTFLPIKPVLAPLSLSPALFSFQIWKLSFVPIVYIAPLYLLILIIFFPTSALKSFSFFPLHSSNFSMSLIIFLKIKIAGPMCYMRSSPLDDNSSSRSLDFPSIMQKILRFSRSINIILIAIERLGNPLANRDGLDLATW